MTIDSYDTIVDKRSLTEIMFNHVDVTNKDHQKEEKKARVKAYVKAYEDLNSNNNNNNN